MDFKIGDVVVFKSGGPIMTIEKIGHRNSVNDEVVATCVWFENNLNRAQQADIQKTANNSSWLWLILSAAAVILTFIIF